MAQSRTKPTQAQQRSIAATQYDIAFTPEDAIALVRRRDYYGSAVRALRPVMRMHCALMTATEASAYTDGVIAEPDASRADHPVCLVVIDGLFVDTRQGPHAPVRPTACVAFDSAGGFVLGWGLSDAQISLPANVGQHGLTRP